MTITLVSSKYTFVCEGLKTCKTCGETKIDSEFYSYKEKLSSYCKPCHVYKTNKRAKERRLHNPEKELDAGRWRKIKQTYGLAKEDYLSILDEQGGVCAICSSKCLTGKRLAVDHNHDTGKVRGLLCSKCNQAIGLLGDSPELIRTAATYLETNGYYGR